MSKIWAINFKKKNVLYCRQQETSLELFYAIYPLKNAIEEWTASILDMMSRNMTQDLLEIRL